MTQYYAAFYRDTDNVEKSSSGGIFYELAKEIINRKGVVFGASAVSVGRVRHIRATTLNEVSRMRKSKYLMSDLGNCFMDIKKDLEDGRHVMFSGTPCQIWGLRVFLAKDYDGLITVEVVCHGMPITDAFMKYVSEVSASKKSELDSFDFRDKSCGWSQNSIKETYKDGKVELIRSLFHPLHSLYLRGINVQKKCGSCIYPSKKRNADITLADFWKYNGTIKNSNYDKGISLVATNTEKGESIFVVIKNHIWLEKVDETDVRESCRHFFHAPYVDKNQEAFDLLISIDNIPFHIAAELCSFFGDVITEKHLSVICDVDERYVVRRFLNDPKDVIYVIDGSKKVRGVVTLGAFLSECEKEVAINNEFMAVRIDDVLVVDKIKNIFDKSNKISRVPVLDSNGRLLVEIRKTRGMQEPADYRLAEYAFKKLRMKGIRCYFYNRPDTISGYGYSKDQLYRINHKLSFDKLCEENSEESLEEIKTIIGEKGVKEYIFDLCKLSPMVKLGGKYQHIDTNSRLVNVEHGHRVSYYEPKEYFYKIHIFGRCGVFGYAVEDRDTIPAQLQRMLKEEGIIVVNHGTRGAKDGQIVNNIIECIFDGTIDEKDLVIVYGAFFPNISTIKSLGVFVNDTTEFFHKSLSKNQRIDFYDKVGHMNAEGYKVIAEYIFDDLEADFINQKEHAKQKLIIASVDKGEYLDDNQKKDLNNYVSGIKAILHSEQVPHNRIGAVVVNCNPFSYGHRYLIEKSLEMVDELLVFVVEEDKSFFSFNQRIEMVRKGVSDLKNVFVFPSGRFMISEYTLPDYFYRNKQKVPAIDMGMDVHIFGKYIAPELNIKYRFVGSERKDDDTYYYNEFMKRILPEYGVSIVEIERKTVGDEPISAGSVREILLSNQAKEKKVDQLKQLIPQTTLTYLLNNDYFQEGGFNELS